MSAPDIFYVEDDTDFAFIMEHAIQEVDNDLSVKIIENGKEALDTLRKITDAKKKPKLILLDLNLPGLSGIDLVKRIREMSFLRHVPVIFFSTSDDPGDVKASIKHGANAYVTKPVGYLSLIACLQELYDVWVSKKLRLNC